jgi:NAD(P)-dependent dehydrogenase (short-subunit alcohol dehydrogenase family)
MTVEATIAPARFEPALLGQTVVVIGGTAGIGLETARRAREAGADVILTARDPDRLHRVGLELGAARVAAWTRVASSCARRCRSGASSVRPTSPHWPCTS